MSICFAPIGLHIVLAAAAEAASASTFLTAAVAGDGDAEQNCFVCPLLQLRRYLQLRWNGGRCSPTSTSMQKNSQIKRLKVPANEANERKSAHEFYDSANRLSTTAKSLAANYELLLCDYVT